MHGEVDGKVAIVTGAASGIGKATAELLHARGAKVVAVDIAEDVQELERDSMVTIVADVSREESSATALAKWQATDDQKRKEQEKAGMHAWMKWVKENEASIIELGSPLGKTKRINAGGISDTKNEITAYTIVQAETHEAAAELFASHPHFMIFPGDSVEVIECLPLPRM